nr:pentatricopeptide repeat-containing protein, mitochondrial [Quercus suber]
MAYARKVFDQIPDPPNIALWNAMFKGYAQNESYREVLVLFSNMKSLDVMPNCFTFPIVLKSCGKINAYVEGQEVQCVAIKGGFRADPFVGTTLIDMYAGGGAVRAAYKVFGEMVERNVVAWTSMISGYILCRDMVSARRLFDLAPERDVVLWNTMVSGYIELGDMLISLAAKPTQRLVEEKLIALLQSCKALKQLKQIQTQIITHSFLHNNGYYYFIPRRFITACAELKKMAYARKVFDQIPGPPNIALWNAMFKGYAHNESYREVLVLFSNMKSLDVMPNCFTFPIVLKSCGKINAYVEGQEVQCVAIKGGFRANPFVGTTLIDMYAGGGAVRAAYKVFGEMVERNVVAWTSMISGYILCSDMVSARRLFDLAPERDVVLWNTMVSGYIELGEMVAARKLFNEMPNRDVMSWKIITHSFLHNNDYYYRFITACAELKKMAYARKVFDQIPDPPNIALWNAMFKGYAQNESYREVLVLFSNMKSLDVMPNCFTFPIVLKSCGKINAYVEGQEVQCVAIKAGFRADQFVGTTLIDMYAGGGAVIEAYKVFGEMVNRNVVAWTSMISGYILCRDMVSARHLFDLAPERDVVLWNTMVSGYIELGDMVAARKLFDEMPNRDVMSWNTVLNGYANNGDVEAYERHSEREEIYGALRGLTKSLRSFEYLPDLMELEQGG